MSIISSEIEYRLSGGTGNTSPNAALGGAMSTAAGGVITTAVLDNLFDDVSGTETAAGDIEYRGFYVKNANATLTWQTVVTWIDQLTTSADDEFDIGLDPAAVNSAMTTIANESTAPVGVTFTRPVTKGTGLAIGNIPAGQFKGIWIRRTVNAGAAAVSGDNGSVRAEGDTL